MLRRLNMAKYRRDPRTDWITVLSESRSPDGLSVARSFRPVPIVRHFDTIRLLPVPGGAAETPRTIASSAEIVLAGDDEIRPGERVLLAYWDDSLESQNPGARPPQFAVLAVSRTTRRIFI